MFGGYCVPSTRQRAKPFEPVEVFRQTETAKAVYYYYTISRHFVNRYFQNSEKN